MKIDRLKLQKALEIVKPGLDSGGQLELSSSFAFIEGRIVTYNDIISISHPMEEIDMEGAISAEELYSFLSKLNKDTVFIKLKEDELLVKCGRSKAGLRLEDLNAGGSKGILYAMQDQKLFDERNWVEITNAENFSRYLLFSTQACSRDMTQPVLNCVHVMDKGTIQSTDGLRVIECNIDPLGIGEDFLIPAASVLEVAKINPTGICVENGWAHFTNEEDTVVSARLIEGDFISQEQLADVSDFVGVQVKFPKDIESMFSRTQQFAKRDFVFDESVKIMIGDGVITLRAVAEKTKSWVEESARIRSKKELAFWVSPSFFLEVLKDTKICMVSRDNTKAKFKEINEEWQYVISLGKEQE